MTFQKPDGQKSFASQPTGMVYTKSAPGKASRKIRTGLRPVLMCYAPTGRCGGNPSGVGPERAKHVSTGGGNPACGVGPVSLCRFSHSEKWPTKLLRQLGSSQQVFRPAPLNSCPKV